MDGIKIRFIIHLDKDQTVFFEPEILDFDFGNGAFATLANQVGYMFVPGQVDRFARNKLHSGVSD